MTEIIARLTPRLRPLELKEVYSQLNQRPSTTNIIYFLMKRLKVLNKMSCEMEGKVFVLTPADLEYFRGLADANVLWAPHVIDMLGRGEVEVTFELSEEIRQSGVSVARGGQADNRGEEV